MVEPLIQSPIVQCNSTSQSIKVPITIDGLKPITVHALLDSGAAGQFVDETFG